MINRIKVTVLLTVYNGSEFLNEAIDSILNQTYCDFEFLIINDGSGDNSKEIILSYSDSRIKYIENDTNKGLIFSLNRGIGIAQGKYIVRMDADDISLPQRIEKQVAFMEDNPSVGVCGSWYLSFGKNNVLVKTTHSDENIRIGMLHQIQLCHPTVIIRKSVLDDNGIYYNPDFLHAEDYDFFFNIGKYSKFHNLQEVLLKYRHHDEKVYVVYNTIQDNNKFLAIQKQFDVIGCNINKKEFDLYLRFANSEFEMEKPEIEAVERFLNKFIYHNSKSKLLPVDNLNKFLSEKWFHLCYNTVNNHGFYSYSRFESSYLSGFFIPDRKKLFFFRIKALRNLSIYNFNFLWNFLSKKETLEKKLITEGKNRWLDIGCGGNFSNGFYYLDYFSTAEIPEEIADKYFKKNIIEINDNDLDILGKFDLIRLQHVIEHFTPEEAKLVLLNCSILLNTNGILLITVPDLNKFISFYKKRNFNKLYTFYNWAQNRIEPEAPESYYFSVFSHSLNEEPHKWCYDFKGLKYLIQSTGHFTNIRQIKLGNRLASIPFTHSRPKEDVCIIASVKK